MKLRFLKMHGTGNDFVLIDCIENRLLQERDTPALAALSRGLCDRRFGVGADQVILLYPSDRADYRMRIFNADGSEVEMCGNGIRCFARYVWDRGYSDRDILDVETMAGIIRPERAGDMVKVDMGEPVLEAREIPVNLDGRVIDHPLQIDDRQFRITCVSMGNPHAVIVVENTADFPVHHYGPKIEKHDLFPRRTNVEFVEILNRSEIRMRVWERGSGETLACGTGASAAAVASILKGLTDREVTVHLLGGDLHIRWDDSNRVFMTGPAVTVFEGTISTDL